MFFSVTGEGNSPSKKSGPQKRVQGNCVPPCVSPREADIFGQVFFCECSVITKLKSIMYVKGKSLSEKLAVLICDNYESRLKAHGRHQEIVHLDF